MHKKGVNKDSKGGNKDNENGLETQCVLSPGKFFFFFCSLFSTILIKLLFTDTTTTNRTRDAYMSRVLGHISTTSGVGVAGEGGRARDAACLEL